MSDAANLFSGIHTSKIDQKRIEQARAIDMFMNLAGLMDNGLSGIMAEVGERTWSSKGCSNEMVFAGVGLG